ncbi:hypothetical protein SAMN05428988_0143 [Chitinophaga sp. YR573]|uniref:hypothetical protein n=1 Tax=Chitinophaga sp. YR573 TaxID=1881040 RepID=UPI0008D4EF67|nr:hypothetical protein [Chitinophaga sp. YR573]SEV88780.1 hypothetical protein SAMN05428988_0143 [Chitinophaga sp. YR573]
MKIDSQIQTKFDEWRKPGGWKVFSKEILRVSLDIEQEAILDSVQVNKMTSVASGTSRGKDFISAVAAICFMYLTPVWNAKGEMTHNTKVALTAPTDRQVGNIMFPEISRLWKNAKVLPGRLTGYDIRTDNEEWFLTGFKADTNNTEAWTGFHAANTMFVVTEASGMPDKVFDAIEGNLQGNSRLLIVFNPNVLTGYAAKSQKSKRWHKFRLNSMNATNVLEKRIVIPGQVDYDWINDKVDEWCSQIKPEEFNEAEGDFQWEGRYYRPSDLFRVKVLGMFPKESSDSLIPLHWIELANKRWEEHRLNNFPIDNMLRLGVDVAGMGRDSSCFCPRYGDYVGQLEMLQSGGKAEHMQIAGITKNKIEQHADKFTGKKAKAFIDTIGEGAGVFSRLQELKVQGIYSCKYSEAATTDGGQPLKDYTDVYEFANMRAYLHWAVRDWLDPHKGSKAMLPRDDDLATELTEATWKFQSNGKIIIEPKEDIKKRLGKSPDKADALANTFYPESQEEAVQNLSGIFF